MATVIPIGQGGYERDLLQLGIPYEALLESVGASNVERGHCPVHSARTAFGYYAYNGMVAGITSQLQPHNYRRIDLNGVLPLWVNEEYGVKLGVTSGNVMTGTRIPKHQPKSRYPKGELVRQMVERNQSSEVTPLFDIAMEVDAESEPLSDHELWLALMYFDKAKAEIRYEVSRPVEINSRGIITQWARRIVLPPYSVEELPGNDPNEGFGEIDVHIEPRQQP